jgi:hypothetical protein
MHKTASRLLRQLWAGLFAVAIAAFAIAGLLELRGDADPQGLHVVPIPEENRVSVQFIIPRALESTGDDSVGLAHYAEHLAWLNAVGSKARAADRHSNAWTGPFTMGYWLSGPADTLPELLETLAGIFEPITLSQSFIEEERAIILREYEQVVGSQIDRRAHEALAAFLYDDHPFGASVIGTPEQIIALDEAAARAYHAATHKPERARLIVAGDVDRRTLRGLLHDLGLRDSLASRPLPAFPSLALQVPDRRLYQFADPDAAPRMLWRRVVRLDEGVPFDRLESYARTLRAILYSALPGGLAGPLRYEAQIARRFDIGVFAIDDAHVELRITAAPDHGVSLTALQAAFETQLAATADAGIPPESFARINRRMVRSLPDNDDEEAIARLYLDHVRMRLSMLREPSQDAQTLMALPASVSTESVNCLLRQIAGDGRDAIAFIGPEEVFR